MVESLFSELEVPVVQKQKKARLGRYERLQRELATDVSDTHKESVSIDFPALPTAKFNFVDVFCGAGGMTQGMKQAGLTPVASVEVNPFASQTHRNNFPECRHYSGDIQEFNSQEWLQKSGSPEVHLVIGGPPCQGFSVAGRRDPEDVRNRLFREFVRVVSELKPWYFVMENVPGILTMQKGAVKTAILEAFAEVGYPNASIAVLEAAAYGVPQLRARAIFVANRFGLANPYPKPQLVPANYRPIESAISDLPAFEPIPEINHEWTRHSAAYMERLAQVPPGGSLYPSFLDAFKRQYPGLPSMTVKENHGGTHIHPHLNRVISAREMARLQTFPDSFIFSGPMKKAMWQIGNAVPPRLAEAIGQALIPSLNAVAATGSKSLGVCETVGRKQAASQLALLRERRADIL